MRVLPRRYLLALLLLATVPPLASCDSGKKKVEVIPPPGDGSRKVLRIAASDEAYFLFQRIAGEYTAKSRVRMEVSQTHSEEVVELLKKKAVDLGVTSRIRGLAWKEAGLSYIPFAYDGVIFLASSDLKVRSIRRSQAREILAGTIRNWKEVGGPDRKINLIARPPHSSVSLALRESLFGGTLPVARDAFVLETSESAYQALKSLGGYFAYVPMSRTIVESFPATPLSLDGVEPRMSALPRGTYPVLLEYGILFPGDAGELVRDFANYLVSVDGKHHLASLGTSPVSESLSLTACHCRSTEGTFAPPGASALTGVLTVGIVPELGTIEQERRYARICQVLAKELGVRTKLKHLESYRRVLQEFQEGSIDTAFVGSLVYGMLAEQRGVLPLARPEARGNSYYRGVVLVPASRPYARFSDLKGRSFAYVPDTSAGDLYTRALIGDEAGGDPARYFSKVSRLSSHAAVVRSVEAGEVEGAAVKDLVLQRMFEASPGLKDRVRVIGMSVPFPENALVAAPSLSPGMRKRILGVLLSLERTPEGKAALADLGAERFIPTSPDDYREMYGLARTVGYRFGR